MNIIHNTNFTTLLFKHVMIPLLLFRYAHLRRSGENKFYLMQHHCHLDQGSPNNASQARFSSLYTFIQPTNMINKCF
jgi:hypothetical protein